MNRRTLRMKRNNRKKKKKLFLGWLSMLILVGVGSLFYVNFPRLELVGAKTIEVPLNQQFEDPGIRLTNHSKNLTEKEYKVEGQVDDKTVGEYRLDYTVSYFGLTTHIDRTVSVVQPKTATPVDMVLQGPSEMTIYKGREYQELGVQVAGGDSDAIQDKVTVSGTVDTQTPGRYEIVYQVTDTSGAVHEVQRVVNVVTKRIYLTFDDGPNEEITPQFLQILKDENVKATFFVTGMGPDALIKQAYDEGHTIGLHTYSHDYATVYASVTSYFDDLNLISKRVQDITGEESKIIRFPGGSSNGISASYSQGIMSILVGEVEARGYQYFDWNVSSGDGSNQESSEIPYQNVVTNLKDDVDNIVLMHDTKRTSADALQKIIDYGKANGFAFEKLEMDSFPAHHGVTN